MTEGAEELPPSPSPDVVKEIDQSTQKQSLAQRAINLFKGVYEDIGSGKAREKLIPFPQTPTLSPQEEHPQQQVAEPSKP